MSVATVTALRLSPSLDMRGMAFPVLIGLSCLFTTQHYVIDIPAGGALGWLALQAFRLVN